jgi:hypothetical protein
MDQSDIVVLSQTVDIDGERFHYETKFTLRVISTDSRHNLEAFLSQRRMDLDRLVAKHHGAAGKRSLRMARIGWGSPFLDEGVALQRELMPATWQEDLAEGLANSRRSNEGER